MDLIADFFAKIIGQSPTVIKRYRMATSFVEIRFIGAVDILFFTRSLRHLEGEQQEKHTPILYVIASDVPAWYPPHSLYFQTDKSLYNNELENLEHRYTVNADLGSETFYAIDRETQQAIFWHRKPLPYYFHTAPFLQLFQRWFTPALTFLHSGGIGYETGGILLAGRGGMGKSTSTMACLESDLCYLGDDFLMLQAEERIAHSLYQVAKLETHNSPRFEALRPYITNPDAVPPEKHHLWIHELRPQQMILSFPIKAIFLPRFLGKRDTRLYGASSIDAMKALVPSSTWLVKADTKLMHITAQLVRQLPCYWLETGTDLKQIPFTIQQFLASC